MRRSPAVSIVLGAAMVATAVARMHVHDYATGPAATLASGVRAAVDVSGKTPTATH